jgi:hypothetical protein
MTHRAPSAAAPLELQLRVGEQQALGALLVLAVFLEQRVEILLEWVYPASHNGGYSIITLHHRATISRPMQGQAR